MNQQERNGLEDVKDKALADMRAENGGALKPNDVGGNLKMNISA